MLRKVLDTADIVRDGDFTRFSSIKQAISYCGLCGDEKSSADKVMRMPISKQRNKHIQFRRDQTEAKGLRTARTSSANPRPVVSKKRTGP